MALLELIEHLPTGGFGAQNTAGVLVTLGSTRWCPGSVPPGWTPGSGSRPAMLDGWPATPRSSPPSSVAVPATGPGPDPAAALGCPTQGAGVDPRLVCDRHLRPAVRLDRDPPPPPLVRGRQDRPGQRPPALRAPPPPSPRHPLRPPPTQPRRLALPPTQIDGWRGTALDIRHDSCRLQFRLGRSGRSTSTSASLSSAGDRRGCPIRDPKQVSG